MDDVEMMIYHQLVSLNEEFRTYADKMEERVSHLEQFKNYFAGIMVAVGVTLKYGYDYCKERIFS